MNKARFQIGTWILPEEFSALSKYAEECNIDNDALGSLLLVRELNLKRLNSLTPKFKKTVPADLQSRFTVRAKRIELKEKILSHFNAHDMKTNMAFGLILRAELDERWLQKACKII